jgi:hypothetical protein
MRTEAEIQRDLRQPGLTRQASLALAQELSERQFEDRLANQSRRSLDMAHTAVQESRTPVMVHSRSTTATDWMGDAADDTPSEYDQAVRATATYWWQNVPEAVKASPEEFDIQARGKAGREASVYGELKAEAQRSFMDTVNRLQRQAGRNVLAESDNGNALSGVPDAQERTPDDEPQDPGTDFPDTGPAEVPSTRAENVKSAAGDPAWLHERNNDPYGTPPNHPFWKTVDAETVGDHKIFQKDGQWYGHNTRQNYWMKFKSKDEAKAHANGPKLDMWAARQAAGENPKSNGKPGEIADESGTAQSGVPDANENPDQTPAQEWIDPPIPSGAADVKNVRNPNDHTSKLVASLRRQGMSDNQILQVIADVDWLGGGQTPTQGPGTPPPNEGQTDPARGDGPAPYNAAPPAAGTPAVADQKRILDKPVVREHGAPGGTPFPAATTAFRQQVQASLRAHAGDVPPWMKKKDDEKKDDGSKPDAPSGQAPPDKQPADDPATNAPDDAAQQPPADPNADPNAAQGQHDNPNPVTADPPNVAPGGTVSVDVGGQPLTGTYVGMEDGYWAVDAGSLHLLLDSGVTLNPQQQPQQQQSGDSGTQAPNPNQ